MILQLPTPDDRAQMEDVMRSAVSTFLRSQNAAARHVMLGAAMAVLDIYGVKQMRVDSYIVLRTREGAAIVATTVLPSKQQKCPGCRADIYANPGNVRIISIMEGFKQHRVTYGCRCGQVFAKKEDISKEGSR